MLYIKVQKVCAEILRGNLIKRGFLSTEDKIIRDDSYIYLPLNEYARENIKSLSGEGLGMIELNKTASYRKPLPLGIGYDLFGNIAIIDAKRKMLNTEATRSAGRKIIALNPRVTTVLEKSGPVQGQFRIRKLGFVCGKRRFIAEYSENGARFVFDVRKVFFSARLAYERARIAALVKNGEIVAVPFAGVGPFPIVIAKRAKPSSIIAIELNKAAWAYMEKNIRLNKTSCIHAICGDFKAVADRHIGIADRVIMQMPTQSMDFIEPMLKIAKEKGKAHVYLFCNAKKVKCVKDGIRKELGSFGYRTKFIFERIVRTYSKAEVEMVFDISFSKVG
jgi:tRNA (guanine37-N1)-methyltransferase